MKCKNCGATLDEGALYCRKCGTAVPQKPESKPKRAAGGKRAKTGWLNRVSALIDGIRAWCVDAFAAVKGWFQNLGRSAFFRNRRLLMLTGIGAALLIVLIIVIASAASCKKTKTYKSPDEVTAAVFEALETGDGEKLYEMTELSVKVLGEHTEIFGEGGTPEEVMRGYYERLADELYTALTEQHGKGFRLSGTFETTIITDAAIFETNRALGLEAAQYAEISGPLSVDEEIAKSIRIVAVELNGAWKPVVVYLY